MSHVLIVEDHEGNRALLKILLEANGYRVTAAGDGLEARLLARAPDGGGVVGHPAQQIGETGRRRAHLQPRSAQGAGGVVVGGDGAVETHGHGFLLPVSRGCFAAV